MRTKKAYMDASVLQILYYLNKIRNNLKLESSEVDKYQFNRVKAMIKHAYVKVPYYRSLFDKKGLSPESIKNKEDFYKIPISTKETMRDLNLYQRMVNGINIRKCKNLRTSGSTGIPLDIYVSQYELLRCKTLPFWNMLFDNGCELTEKTLRVTHPFLVEKPYWFQRLNILRDYFATIDNDVDEQLNKFIQIKPHVIRGYTSAIKSLALKIKERGIKVVPPKVIFTTAEVLVSGDRELISSIFQSKVIDYYCCSEFGIMAWECKRHSGYHINVDNVMMEFIKNGTPALPGEESEIVITGLNNYAMPFIRYKIGDRGIFQESRCPCGNNSPLIQTIIGRSNDQVILSNGKTISPFLLTNLITCIPGIIEFQLAQKELGIVHIRIVKDKNCEGHFLANQVEKQCKAILGNAIKIEVFLVDNIPKEKSGKFKIIKNEVDSFAPHISQ